MLNLLLKIVAISLPLYVLLWGAKDAVLKELWRGHGLRTWHIETAVVGIFLATVVLVFGHFFPPPDPSTEWIGWAALLFAHGRNSVMMRMMETQEKIAAKADPEAVKALVPCWKMAAFYLYAGETFWALYFLRHHAWAALAGVAVFVGYARWRGFYSKRR